MTTVPALAFVSGKSGTGKTTLLIAVLKCLKARGYRVGTVKHARHRIVFDTEGKDSARHAESGSDVTVVAGPDVLAAFRRVDNPSLSEALTEASRETDIVLVEGFKESSIPKIEVFRAGHIELPLCLERGGEGVEKIVAVASDISLQAPLPVLPLNDSEKICDFIEERFLLDSLKKPDQNDISAC
jgi:molybdopterin-guanine dinucleotide biosynthesis protein MobB